MTCPPTTKVQQNCKLYLVKANFVSSDLQVYEVKVEFAKVDTQLYLVKVDIAEANLQLYEVKVHIYGPTDYFPPPPQLSSSPLRRP